MRGSTSAHRLQILELTLSRSGLLQLSYEEEIPLPSILLSGMVAPAQLQRVAARRNPHPHRRAHIAPPSINTNTTSNGQQQTVQVPGSLRLHQSQGNQVLPLAVSRPAQKKKRVRGWKLYSPAGIDESCANRRRLTAPDFLLALLWRLWKGRRNLGLSCRCCPFSLLSARLVRGAR